MTRIISFGSGIDEQIPGTPCYVNLVKALLWNDSGKGLKLMCSFKIWLSQMTYMTHFMMIYGNGAIKSYGY